jgi:tetratricopeptide (TPR) repeat protein
VIRVCALTAALLAAANPIESSRATGDSTSAYEVAQGRVDAVESAYKAEKCDDALENGKDILSSENFTQSTKYELLKGRLLHLLGNCFLSLNSLDEAESNYLSALAIRERLLDPNDSELARTIHNLALVKDRQGHAQEAESGYRRALAIWDISDHTQVNILRALSNLGALLLDIGRYSDAEVVLHREVAIERQMANRSVELAGVLRSLGWTDDKLGHYAEAETYYQQAIELIKDANLDTSPTMAFFLQDYGLLYFHSRQMTKALDVYQRALTIEEATSSISPTFKGRLLVNIGLALQEMHRFNEAEDYFRRALPLIDASHKQDFIIFLTSYAGLYDDMGRYDEAITPIDAVDCPRES